MSIQDEIQGALANLLTKGFNLSDFDVNVSENGYSIVPLPSFEQRQIAKQEDEPIKVDVNDIGEVLGITLDDTITTAETVGMLIDIIVDLQTRVEELEGK